MNMTLYKVTITPRGGSLGFTSFMQKEHYNSTKEEMLHDIRVSLAGRAARRDCS